MRILTRTKNEEQRTKLLWYPIKVALPFILATFLILTIPHKEIINLRFDNLTSIDNLQFKGDPAIHSRLDAWELSWVMIKENPILCSGFGSFNGYKNIEWTKSIKYSHNIILETASELGILGLIVLGSLLIVMFRSSYQYSLFTFFFLLFSFFLSLFSKELSNQGILWIAIVFISFNRVQDSEKIK